MEPSPYADDPEFLEAQRQRLHDARATADRVAGDLDDDVRAEGTDDPGDLQLDDAAAQNGTIPMDREWRMAQQAQERLEGDAIDAALARVRRGSHESPGRWGRDEKCFPYAIRVVPGQAILALFQPVVSTPKASRTSRWSADGRSTTSISRPARSR